MVAALYVDTRRGPYPGLLGENNCWGLERDAKSYRGPDAVVAHPPCGPWGRMAQWCTLQDPECGPIAVRQVRRFGGVLEHPIATRLREHCFLPTPWSLAGGRPLPMFAAREWALNVEQVRWGHIARKATYLFFVGVQPCDLPPIPPPKKPVAWIGGPRPYRDAAKSRGMRLARKSETHITPVDFAAWLVTAVRNAESRQGSLAA